jgi:L-lactate permease
MVWSQIYDPLNNAWLSTFIAALPVIVLLGALGIFRMQAHVAALLGLAVALAAAVFVFRMPVEMAGKTALLGAAFGLLPIGWIILNIIFLYRLTERLGLFKVLQDSISGITDDRRLQLLLDRLLLRRLLRRSGRFRHSGRRDRSNPDRSRVLAARSLGTVSDREYGAGGIWRARLARPCARCGDRSAAA